MTRNTETFFDTLFAGANRGNVLVWTLREKREKLSSHIPVPDYARVAAVAAAEAAHTDVYFGCGLRDPSITDPRVRGGSDDVIAIGALWLEVDQVGPGHQRTDLPVNRDDVRRILAGGLPPSIVVSSGGGLHLYWLLRQLWYFSDSDDRSRAAELLRRHQAFYIANADALGWHVDATHDLARVLRVPNTFNRKQEAARPVKVVACHPERRYALAELGAVLPAEVVAFPRGSSRESSEVEISTSLRPAAGRGGRDEPKDFTAKEIITAWNEAHSVEKLLATHGYKRTRAKPRGDVASVWLAPTSQTKMAGVKLFTDGRVFSWHGSDPLNGPHSHDCFGVYTVLEHRGHVGEAVQAAAEAMGMVRKKSATLRRSARRPVSARLTRWEHALQLAQQEHVRP